MILLLIYYSSIMIQIGILYYCTCICYSLFNQPPFLGLEIFFFNTQEGISCLIISQVVLGPRESRGLVKKEYTVSGG